jgi:hypothetical protein
LIGEVLRGEQSALFTDPGGLALGLVLLAALAFLFGILAGAPVGLTLGLVDGLLLGAMTFAFFRPGTDRRGYRAAAGAMCAGASLVILIVDWAFHGYPGYRPNCTLAHRGRARRDARDRLRLQYGPHGALDRRCGALAYGHVGDVVGRKEGCGVVHGEVPRHFRVNSREADLR